VRLGIDVEIRGRAESRYDLGTIERRLAVLAGRTDAEAVRERAFLRSLLEAETKKRGACRTEK
jgi:hypothetical protein